MCSEALLLEFDWLRLEATLGLSKIGISAVRRDSRTYGQRGNLKGVAAVLARNVDIVIRAHGNTAGTEQKISRPVAGAVDDLRDGRKHFVRFVTVAVTTATATTASNTEDGQHKTAVAISVSRERRKTSCFMGLRRNEWT